jgi:hypothetical protein
MQNARTPTAGDGAQLEDHAAGAIFVSACRSRAENIATVIENQGRDGNASGAAAAECVDDILGPTEIGRGRQFEDSSAVVGTSCGGGSEEIALRIKNQPAFRVRSSVQTADPGQKSWRTISFHCPVAVGVSS